MTAARARAPGRVNLIGDHTDYTGGLVLPMAIDLGTTVSGTRGGARVHLVSDAEAEPADIALSVADPSAVEPPWARYVAGVVSVVAPTEGFDGTVTTTIPIGAGLSSSAALEVAVALALGFDGDELALALACQQAEQRASGVPCGVMDQLAAASGREGHALLIDCRSLDVDPVAMPDGLEVVVVDSGERRRLATSAYGERRRQCEAAEAIIGPLRDASLADVAALPDETLRRRARHVVTENGRVRAFADALRGGDVAAAGRLADHSHRSLAEDFEVSTPTLDALVDRLRRTPGVLGARLTGAGFGGCVLALCERGAPVDGFASAAESGIWRVRPSAGARR